LTVLARVAFALLVAATFGAFFVAQSLKSGPSVINNVDVVEYFSPVCQCPRSVQKVTFKLDEDDDVTVDVVDEDGGRVARLATARPAGAFTPVRLQWRGTADGGRRAPDGRYRIRFSLRRRGRSVIYPTSFLLDTKPPVPQIRRTSGPIVTPGQPVELVWRGAQRRAIPEFTVLRTDEGEPQPVRHFKGARNTRRATWDGLDDQGRTVPPGTYLIQVAVADRAGNVGTMPRIPLVPGKVKGRPGVIVRGIAVQPPVKAIPAGQLISFRVDPRGNSYRWSVRKLGSTRPRKRSTGRKTNSIIATRAPSGVSGVYVLEVRAGRYSAQVPVAVQSEKREPLLVVLPMIRWLGTNALDDPRNPDGIPNTLTAGATVPYPRAFAGEDGLPQGFADEVAPLLVMLDRARVRYDVTTDLALSLSRDPRATDRKGVLFAGSSPWASRSLARRLRRYVEDGGRLAIFGRSALRAGVQVGSARLSRATPPGPADALGGRIADPRDVDTDLAPTKDDPLDLPVFAGADAFLGGFKRVEELISPGGDAEIAAGIGQLVTEEEVAEAEAAGEELREERPAFSMVKQGKGVVFRVGIDGWVKRIAEGDGEVIQITRNVVDLLRRVNPRPRSRL
jgi:hypothetical protein